jgi:hypothetical protein
MTNKVFLTEKTFFLIYLNNFTRFINQIGHFFSVISFKTINIPCFNIVGNFGRFEISKVFFLFRKNNFEIFY